MEPADGRVGVAAGRATYLAYRTLGTLLRLMPRPAATLVAAIAGATLARAWRRVRPVVRSNIGRVLGPGAGARQLERAVDRAFASYAHYWIESARLPGTGPLEVMRRFSVEGFEPLAAALDEKRGAIIALPHLGSWEIGGLWLTLKGYPMTTVAEALQPPELFEWFKSQREAMGLRVLAPGNDSGSALLKTLRAGRLVGLVCDRDLAGNGVDVTFFGERTTLPAGPALLALRSGAPLFPTAVYQHPGGRYHGVIRPALPIERTGKLRADVQSLTEALAGELELLIEAAPSQWHMFQPNWPSDRQVS